MTFTITGWNGTTTLAGFVMPNWLVVLAAAAVASLAWTRAAAIGRPPTGLSIALAGYGLVHLGLIIAILAASEDATVGIGSLLCAIALAVQVGFLVRGVLEAKAASRQSSRQRSGRRTRRRVRRALPGLPGQSPE